MNAPYTLWSWTLTPNAGNRADSLKAHALSSAIRHVALQGAGVDCCVPAITVAQLQAFATHHGIGDAIGFIDSTDDQTDSAHTALACLIGDTRVRIILMARRHAGRFEGLATVQDALRAGGRLLLIVDDEGTALPIGGPPVIAIEPHTPIVGRNLGADDRQEK